MTDLNDVLVDAIKNGLQVTFRYKSASATEEEPTQRIVEPWIYGTRNGKKCLYGRQVSGGGGNGMRRFNLEKVKHVELTGDHMSHQPENATDVTKWDEIIAQWDHKVSV